MIQAAVDAATRALSVDSGEKTDQPIGGARSRSNSTTKSPGSPSEVEKQVTSVNTDLLVASNVSEALMAELCIDEEVVSEGYSSIVRMGRDAHLSHRTLHYLCLASLFSSLMK